MIKSIFSQPPAKQRKGNNADKIIELHKKSGFRNVKVINNQ